MLEVNFIAFIRAAFPSVPVYSFIIPDDAPSPAFCFESVGTGISTYRNNNENIKSRTVKLTISSTNVSDIYNDKHLRDYIESATTLNELFILSARITAMTDSFNRVQGIYERTYTIIIKTNKGI